MKDHRIFHAVPLQGQTKKNTLNGSFWATVMILP